MTIIKSFNISIIVFNKVTIMQQESYARKDWGMSYILQQSHLFENNVSQNAHQFIFAYSHQSVRRYRFHKLDMNKINIV
jgi:ABC-type lipopolysaccharide export system ATPase subunit